MQRVPRQQIDGLTYREYVGRYGLPEDPTQVPEAWEDETYNVLLWRIPKRDLWDWSESPGATRYLSIARKDGAPAHDWLAFQRIKNELAGSEIEAVELYPAESRLVDSANRYLLWCYAPGERAPWGFQERNAPNA